jgi:predicted RecA/RadA family phage recombinase
MKNSVSNGNVLVYSNSSGSTKLSGALVVIGALAGIAVADIPDGDSGSLSLKGVFTIPKAAGAVTQGQKLYWVSADSNLSTTASGNTLVGVAFRAAASGDATVELLLTNGI